MNNIDKGKIKGLIHSLGLKYKLPDEVIKDMVDTPYRFTKEVISNMDIPEGLSKEEFEGLKRSFRYLAIGTVYLDYNLYKKYWFKKKQMDNINKDKWKK